MGGGKAAEGAAEIFTGSDLFLFLLEGGGISAVKEVSSGIVYIVRERKMKWNVRKKKYEIKPNYKLDWCSVCVYARTFRNWEEGLPIVKDIVNHVCF